MAKGAQIGCKRKTRTKVRLKNKDSDQSDEDYKVSEDEEFEESEDEYCSSLVGDDSEDSLGEFFEEEEESTQKKVKRIGKPKGRKARQVKKKKKNVKRRRKRVTRKEEEEEDEDEEDYYDDYEDDEYISTKKLKKDKASRHKDEDDDTDFSYEEDDDLCSTKKLKKDKASRNRDEDDDDDDDDDDDTDFSYEEDDEPVHKIPKKISRVSRTKVSRGTGHRNTRKRNKFSCAEANEESDYDDDYDMEFIPDEKDLEPVTRRTNVRNQVVTRQNRSDTFKEIRDEKPTTVTKKKRTEHRRGRRKKYTVDSDSDMASSASSDYEYTISEEEREQVKEASELCRGFPTSLRSSPLRISNKEPQRKQPAKKGKEKVSDMKVEAVKQVCGICLSEEEKRTIRGILNCCSHFFCFPCIMEWSKVETRCPLCKQRFKIINRKVRADGGHDLRDAVFQVPERNQVYQPSEEELMDYLDPYENVLCSECHHGGDDALMLLCDLCDSPAHTYCVGLGHEVPEDNWYCDGCRPTVNTSSSNSQATNHIPNHGTANNFSSIGSSSPFRPTVRETFDLNEAYVPDTPLTAQIPVRSQPPRTSYADRHQSSFSASGFAVLTLSARRRIHRQIQHIRSIRGRRYESNENAGQASNMPQNIDVQGSGWRGGRALPDEASASVNNLSHFGLPNQNEVLGMNETSGAGFVHRQLRPHISRSNNGGDSSAMPEGTISSRTFQGEGPIYTNHF